MHFVDSNFSHIFAALLHCPDVCLLLCHLLNRVLPRGNICCWSTGKLYTQAMLGVGIRREKNLGTAAELLSKEAFDGGLRQNTDPWLVNISFGSRKNSRKPNMASWKIPIFMLGFWGGSF